MATDNFRKLWELSEAAFGRYVGDANTHELLSIDKRHVHGEHPEGTLFGLAVSWIQL